MNTMALQRITLNTEKLDDKNKYSVKIDGVDTGYIVKERFKDGSIKWYPFKYYPSSKTVKQKYSKIEFIGTDFGKIPSTGFSNNLNVGYGFTKPQGVDSLFRYLEENSKSVIKGIMFTKNQTHLEKETLFINLNDFFDIVKKTKRYKYSIRREEKYFQKTLVNNILPGETPQPLKQIYIPGSLKRFMEHYSDVQVKLNKEDVDSIIHKLDIDHKTIVSTKKTIDKIYIEDVLGEYKKLMAQKTDTKTLEECWHQFFKSHSWIFSSVFAYPAAYFKDKLNIGGHDITGNTDKIIDFLMRNKFTKNITFIEIKTHLTSIIHKSPYRKPNIYSMSSNLSGAIVQVIDQKSTFLKSYHTIKGNGRIDSLNSNCLVVIGDTNELDNKGKLDSFELFRLSNKDVTIVTFNELQEKMEALINIFTK